MRHASLTTWTAAAAAMLAAILVAPVPPASAQVAKPNIILILSDDFGYGDSGPTAEAPAAACPRRASTGSRARG